MYKTFLKMSLIILLTYCTQAFSASLDRIVAIVNDTVITQSELQEGMETVKHQLEHNNMSLPTENILRKQVLDQIINRKLQLEAAKQANIEISDKEINRVINHIADDNKLTTDELYQKLTEQGLTKTKYRDEIRNELLLQKIQQAAIGNKLNVSPKEVNDFLRSQSWQVINSKEYHLNNKAEQQKTAQQLVYQRKVEEELQNWITGLRAAAYINLNPES